MLAGQIKKGEICHAIIKLVEYASIGKHYTIVVISLFATVVIYANLSAGASQSANISESNVPFKGLIKKEYKMPYIKAKECLWCKNSRRIYLKGHKSIKCPNCTDEPCIITTYKKFGCTKIK